MGCDYYIHTYLEIEHTYGITYYTLEEHRRGWYDDITEDYRNSDDDDENNTAKRDAAQRLWEANIKYHLMPNQPVVLIENGQFVSERFREKYTPILQEIIQGVPNKKKVLYEDVGEPLTQMSDIICVTKKEIRYEPGRGPPFYWFDSESEENSDHND